MTDTPVSVVVRGTLPAGVIIKALTALPDDRGCLVEVFRQQWVDAPAAPLQWNVVTSVAGVMRGMHIHLGYFEYYVVLQGRVTIGYRDTRPGSPTEGCTGLVMASGRSSTLTAVAAPPGILHGIYTHEATVLLTAMTRYWDTAQELGCNWRDPALEIDWPFSVAVTSARDRELPLLAEVQGRVPRYTLPGSAAGR